jgi:PRTRC genetic system protein C
MPDRIPAIFEKERSMAIEVSEVQRSYRYNGIQLPDVPGLDAREIRDLYSAQYPELVSAEIEIGEIRNGVQEITFKRAVGTKG